MPIEGPLKEDARAAFSFYDHEQAEKMDVSLSALQCE
jgi:hypothetical protein